MHEQQLTSGLLRNIAPMMATFCNKWNMHCIKWICSSPPFGSIESIHATRANLSISPFQSSTPSLTIRSSFACMEPTTGDESCIQMDRQGAFCHFPRIKSMPISKSRLSGIQHARQMQWQWRNRSYMAKRNQSRLPLMAS